MIKKHVIFASVCIATSVCSAAIDTDKLEEALEQSELGRVKSLLTKTERQEMTPLARKKLLVNLYDSAVEITEQRTSNISLIGHWRDTAKSVSGTVLTALSGLCLTLAVFNSNNIRVRAGVVGLLSGAIGLPLLYKGITCTFQKGQIAQAKTVEKFLKGKLTEGEAESAK